MGIRGFEPPVFLHPVYQAVATLCTVLADDIVSVPRPFFCGNARCAIMRTSRENPRLHCGLHFACDMALRMNCGLSKSKQLLQLYRHS